MLPGDPRGQGDLMSVSDATTASNGFEPDADDDEYEPANNESGDELDPDDDSDWDEDYDDER